MTYKSDSGNYNNHTLELESIESESGPENKDAINVFVEQEKKSLENEIEDDIDLYGENQTSVDDDLSEMTTIEKVKHHANQEIFMLLVATEVSKYPTAKIDPLQCWQDNKDIYPNVAKCAQKWSGVPATSTPSEGVFSICGIVDTAKRNRSNGKSYFIISNYVKL